VPENNGILLVAAGVSAISTSIGLIVGGALALVGKGKKEERIEASLARSHERLSEHEKIFATHDQALKNILASFFDDKGEPRYITSIVCGEKENICQRQIHEKIGNLSSDIGRIENDLLAVKTAQDNNLKTILTEIRKGQ